MNSRHFSLAAVCLLIFSGTAIAQSPSNTASATATTGEQRQSLDGKWDFTTNANALNDTMVTWDSLEVPGNWDVQPAYRIYRGKAWYRRTFTVPAGWKGRHIRLCFGAVNQTAEVTLNGKTLGQHFGGYTPFEFDVTDDVNYGGDNTVIVSADNTYHRGAWWPWGGISRSVDLVANGDVRIVWQHITPTPDLQAGDAKIGVAYKIANDSDSEQNVDLVSTIAGAPDVKIEQKVDLKPHSADVYDFSTSMPKTEVKLWDFDHPNLYTLVTRVSSNGTTLHEKSDRFGVRQVEVKPDGLYLNGEKVRVCGFNRVSDSNQYGNTEPDVLVHQDIDLMKSAGANFARLMHTPQAPNLLDYLDEKGMMIIAEIPVWGGNDPQIKTNNPVTEQWLTEMINRDYNHPCIIGWSPGNEMRGHYHYVESMFDYIRKNLDTSRLLTHTSNTASSPWTDPKTDPAGISDLILNNSYGGWGWASDIIHKRWPDKPIFFSEWGSRQFGTNLNGKIPGFESGYAETEKNHPYVIGISIWTFNDYRNGEKKPVPAPIVPPDETLSPSENKKAPKAESEIRAWGVVDVDRHPKAAYQQVRAAYSPVHALTIEDGKVRIVPRTPDEIPSYALRGYQVKWEAQGTDGTVQNKGTISVPDLKPGDPPWEAPITDAPKIVVHLITPTGYDVTDATSAP